LEICVLVIYVDSHLNRRCGEEDRELPPTPAGRQFPALLRKIVIPNKTGPGNI